MPMTWDANADAKLFAAVLKIHDIKPNYQALAAEMGPECTPKAIMHRFANIKSRGKNGGGPGSSKSTPTSASRSFTMTPRKNTAPRTPTKRTNGGSTKKPQQSVGLDDDDASDDDENLTLAGIISGKHDSDMDDDLPDGATQAPPSRVSARASTRPRQTYTEPPTDDEDDVEVVEITPVKRAKTTPAPTATARGAAAPLTGTVDTDEVFADAVEDQLRLELDGAAAAESFAF